MREKRVNYRRRLLGLLLALAILLPSLIGFGNKFLELIRIYRGDADGAFAVAPITNYILASTGFLLLFFWAAANGMFRDIERPKYAMLDNERRLDKPERAQSFWLDEEPSYVRN
ncbi:MAG TPA: hypothetical protein VGN12_03310 [Pirellulales bacterium]|jgi:nitrogen fixation-related uncharacterized protein